MTLPLFHFGQLLTRCEKIFHIFFNRQPIKKATSCFRGGKENRKIMLTGDRKKYFLTSRAVRKVAIIYIYTHERWFYINVDKNDVRLP